jgi:hypothetical protein
LFATAEEKCIVLIVNIIRSHIHEL